MCTDLNHKPFAEIQNTSDYSTPNGDFTRSLAKADGTKDPRDDRDSAFGPDAERSRHKLPEIRQRFAT